MSLWANQIAPFSGYISGGPRAHVQTCSFLICALELVSSAVQSSCSNLVTTSSAGLLVIITLLAYLTT